VVGFGFGKSGSFAVEGCAKTQLSRTECQINGFIARILNQTSDTAVVRRRTRGEKVAGRCAERNQFFIKKIEAGQRARHFYEPAFFRAGKLAVVSITGQ